MKKKLIFIILLTLILLQGLIYSADIKVYPEEESLKTDKLEIIFEKIHTSHYNTGMMIYVKIKNISNEIVVFDSDNLELVDESDGMTYYSITKDKSVIIEGGSYWDNLIAKATIKPGRMISGFLNIKFPKQNASKVEHFKLYYNDFSVSMHLMTAKFKKELKEKGKK